MALARPLTSDQDTRHLDEIHGARARAIDLLEMSRFLAGEIQERAQSIPLARCPPSPPGRTPQREGAPPLRVANAGPVAGVELPQPRRIERWPGDR